MAGHLTTTLKVRVDEELRAELERQAQLEERPPAWLHRRILREGLEARRARGPKVRRGT